MGLVGERDAVQVAGPAPRRVRILAADCNHAHSQLGWKTLGATRDEEEEPTLQTTPLTGIFVKLDSGLRGKGAPDHQKDSSNLRQQCQQDQPHHREIIPGRLEQPTARPCNDA